MSRHTIYYAVTVALGGFLFGFDTAVISGAEQSIQFLWTLDEMAHGLTVSIALIGTVIGALFGGIPAEVFGRKKTLFWIGILYLVSALGSALVDNWYLFLFYRFIGGLGVGASSVAAPMYISEIAPANDRGKLVALFQFNIVFGILLAYVSNYLISTFDIASAWRWMLGVEAFPALVYSVMVLTVPESPRWLILRRGDIDQARRVFLMNHEANIEGRIAQINESAVEKKAKGNLNLSHYKRPIMLAVLFAFFNQLSGINAIIYYAPRIFEIAGLGKSAALLSSAGVGVVNFVFTLLAISLIDKLGRKMLMHYGSFGLIFTLGTVAFSFYTSIGKLAIPYYLFTYIAFFAFSQGAVIWVFISEIFPNEKRAFGQSLGSFTHWILAAAIAFVFPAFTTRLGPANTFMIFAGMMVLQWLFVWKVMPETKGKTLEDLGKTLTNE